MKYNAEVLYEFPGIAETNYRKLGSLKQKKPYSLTILEGRSPKSRCWPGLTFPKAPEEGPSLPLPASGGSGRFWGSGHSLVCGHVAPSLPLSSPGLLPCVFVFSPSLSYRGTSSSHKFWV